MIVLVMASIGALGLGAFVMRTVLDRNAPGIDAVFLHREERRCRP